jgi:phospholipid-binding lipoprotein MlaA
VETKAFAGSWIQPDRKKEGSLMKASSKNFTVAVVVCLISIFAPILGATLPLTSSGLLQNLALAQADATHLYPVEMYKAYPEAPEEPIADPLEPYNRAIFRFNDRLYFWVLEPAGRGYARAVPEDLRISIRSAFYNLVFPVRFVNNLLQLKPRRAGVEFARFFLNSTWGMGGLFDVASKCTQLNSYDEEFGQTLGHYGMRPIIFIVWPLIGPSSLRDSIGLVGDAFVDPLFYFGPPYYTTFALKGLQTINDISLRLGEYEDFLAMALDPYIAMRNGYIQYRENLIRR